MQGEKVVQKRLITQVDISRIYEDVLGDVIFTLRTAQKTGRFADALKLLSLSADILQGRDVFSSNLKGHPSIAIRHHYLDRLLDYLKMKGEDYEVATYYISIARTLAEGGQVPELAKDLDRRGWAIIQQGARYGGAGRGFTIESFCDRTLFIAHQEGLKTALEKLQKATPQENIYPVYIEVLKLWVSAKYNSKNTISEIKDILNLNDFQRAYFLLGVLGGEDGQLTKEDLEKLASEVLNFLQNQINRCR